MWRLVKYLEENSKEMTDSRSEGKIREVAEKLAEIRPECSDNERHELAIAIMSAMWLGYRAQEKEAAAFFRDAILQAFEAGRRFQMMQ
ncbi:MAG TPA: hypothetical protein VHK86_06960 [Nitrososphaera sp.]|jgi:hypothetical protein|nr:hypothetical protein [Nitrososphaera sp.]HEX2614167.1 hypothetical protein [Nitrososphaera sp.]